MKTDLAMQRAVMKIAKLRYAPKASVEGKAVGAFCMEVLLPLMTTHANSNSYKLARQGLLNRGRTAETITESES